MKAATLGVVDFAEADPLDPRWWRQLWWRIGELHRSLQAESLKLLHDRQMALIANGRLPNDQFRATQETASEVEDLLQRLQQPWLKEPDPQQKLNAARQAYAEEFGDMESPEHKEAEAKLLAWFENNLNNPPKGMGERTGP